jgi:hypothetical protein
MDIRMQQYVGQVLLLVMLVLVFLMGTAKPVIPFVAYMNTIEVNT